MYCFLLGKYLAFKSMLLDDLLLYFYQIVMVAFSLAAGFSCVYFRNLNVQLQLSLPAS